MIYRDDRSGRAWTAGVVLVTAVLGGCAGEPGTPDTPTVDGAPSATTSTTTTTSAPPAREPHIVVLTATGTATVESFTYVVDGRPVEERSVPLPWRTSLIIPADGAQHEWSLTVQHRDGHLEVVATVDGVVVTRGGGGGTGTGTVKLSGGVEG